jgi:hypothetical protein
LRQPGARDQRGDHQGNKKLDDGAQNQTGGWSREA